MGRGDLVNRVLREASKLPERSIDEFFKGAAPTQELQRLELRPTPFPDDFSMLDRNELRDIMRKYRERGWKSLSNQEMRIIGNARGMPRDVDFPLFRGDDLTRYKDPLDISFLDGRPRPLSFSLDPSVARKFNPMNRPESLPGILRVEPTDANSNFFTPAYGQTLVDNISDEFEALLKPNARLRVRDRAVDPNLSLPRILMKVEPFKTGGSVMPLTKSPSKGAFRSNIQAEMSSGRPQKQALAIAFDVKRRAEDAHARKKYAEGGSITGVTIPDRQAYERYVIEQQSEGNEAMPYEWLKAQGATPRDEASTGGTDLLTRLRRAVFGRAMGGRVQYAGGGQVDTELLNPSYYESDLIPPATAGRAAHMAGDRMIGNAMSAGTDVDSRQRLRNLIARVQQMRQGGSGQPQQAEVGSREELLKRMSAPRMATGGSVHHVNPEEFGFSHEYPNEVYGYERGGSVVSNGRGFSRWNGPTKPLRSGTGEQVGGYGRNIPEVRDFSSRPMLDNGDGSFSTERTITIQADGRSYVIPTIVNGAQLTPEQAIQAWKMGVNPEVRAFDYGPDAEEFALDRSASIGRERGPEFASRKVPGMGGRMANTITTGGDRGRWESQYDGTNTIDVDDAGVVNITGTRPNYEPIWKQDRLNRPGRFAGGGLVDQSAGALAALGQQLIAERQQLGNSYGMPPNGPEGPPTSMVGQQLQASLGPRLPMATGGSVMQNRNVMKMALKDPRVKRFCSGGRM